jgi:alkylhydroperoxidase/carboxymuconolactone decarboxylase family protein YurZ
MDDRTRLLVCLGSAAAANCVSCFHHFHAKALAAGLGAQDVREAVELGSQVQHGAHAVLMGAVEAAIGQGGGDAEPPSCCCGSTPDCGT